jgi:hypothetical protein
MLGTRYATLGQWRLGVVTSTGASVAIAGSCTLVTATAGALGVDHALAGQADTSTAAAGALTRDGALGGQTDASTTASGTVGKDQGGAGQANVSITAAGALARASALAGAAACTTTLVGAVTMPVHVELDAGIVAGVVTAVGTLAHDHRRVVMATTVDEVIRIEVTDKPPASIVVKDSPTRIVVRSTGRAW